MSEFRLLQQKARSYDLPSGGKVEVLKKRIADHEKKVNLKQLHLKQSPKRISPKRISPKKDSPKDRKQQQRLDQELHDWISKYYWEELSMQYRPPSEKEAINNLISAGYIENDELTEKGRNRAMKLFAFLPHQLSSTQKLDESAI